MISVSEHFTVENTKNRAGLSYSKNVKSLLMQDVVEGTETRDCFHYSLINLDQSEWPLVTAPLLNLKIQFTLAETNTHFEFFGIFPQS